MYGIGNTLISRDTPVNTGHNILVYRGHDGAMYLSKMSDTGSYSLKWHSMVKRASTK